ncbi:MAG: hypothetical protein QOJ26_923 [Thermoplasmata archaeon]|nr:hypothetical protein [Thermoplasmata archaeon]MEA3166054.1 hypothetical protein [Thermoplasmata archaeon]
MVDWFSFGLAAGIVLVVQWGLILLLPMTITYYEGGQARRRSIRMSHLLWHMAKGQVEMHGPLLFVDTGQLKGNVGAHWTVLALAWLVVGPWVSRTRLH